MEILKYKMYKNNTIIHEGECPVFFYTHIMPVGYKNYYDFIELAYNNKIYIIQQNELDISYDACWI